MGIDPSVLPGKCTLCGREDTNVFVCKIHGRTDIWICKNCTPAWRKLGKCPKCEMKKRDEEKRARLRAEEDARRLAEANAKKKHDDGFLTGVAVAWLI